MKIVHAAAEVFPYVKTGGLADMVGALSATLADNGHDVSVFVPGYRELFECIDALPTAHLFKLEIHGGEVRAFSPQNNLTVFLLCNKGFFDRSGIYGVDGHDFDDNREVTTVSPQYAREIKTIEFGCGLDETCGKTSAGQKPHWPTSGCIRTPLEQPAMIPMCNFQNHRSDQRQWQHRLIKTKQERRAKWA